MNLAASFSPGYQKPLFLDHRQEQKKYLGVRLKIANFAFHKLLRFLVNSGQESTRDNYSLVNQIANLIISRAL